MAAPAAGAAGAVGPNSPSVPGRQSVTGRLTRQTSQLFRGGTVKNLQMDEIAATVVPQVWKDDEVQPHEREGKALGVMKRLLAEAESFYPDSAIRAAIQGQVKKLQLDGAAAPKGAAKADAAAGSVKGKGPKKNDAGGICNDCAIM